MWSGQVKASGTWHLCPSFKDSLLGFTASSFGHYPQIMTIDKGKNIDQLITMTNAESASTTPPNDLPRRSSHTCEQDPEMLEFLHYGQDLRSQLKESTLPFSPNQGRLSSLKCICCECVYRYVMRWTHKALCFVVRFLYFSFLGVMSNLLLAPFMLVCT